MYVCVCVHIHTGKFVPGHAMKAYDRMYNLDARWDERSTAGPSYSAPG